MITEVPRALWNAGKSLARQASTYKTQSPDTRNDSEFWALNDVSFEIKQGEVVGIIGRNGAGKSTLLKILSRITEPTSGRFGLRGRVASLLEVGTGFHPELTGRENIYVSGVTLGMTRAEIKERFDEIVEFSGVEKFLDTPVKHYSSGMQVRLGFAVAAHLDSEILIVDEVLAVGDAEFQRKCIGKMSELARSSHRTVLFVSHNLPSCLQLTQRCCLFDSGQLRFDGSAADVIGFYEGLSLRAAETTVDLTRFPRPDKQYIPSLTFATCETLEGTPANQINSGKGLILRIGIDSANGASCPVVGFSIDSIQGVRLFASNNRIYEGASIRDLKGRKVFVCTMNSVPLSPGDYLLSFCYSADGVYDIDRVDHALRLSVTSDEEIFLQDRSPYGVVMIENHWTTDEQMTTRDESPSEVLA
jgi:lipopolysaccharide transport system ATP-binding protein